MTGVPPEAVALGDQLHAQITDEAYRDFKNMAEAEKISLAEHEMTLIEIGIQVGLQAALRVVRDSGWLKAPQ